jgi:hypothetical protein
MGRGLKLLHEQIQLILSDREGYADRAIGVPRWRSGEGWGCRLEAGAPGESPGQGGTCRLEAGAPGESPWRGRNMPAGSRRSRRIPLARAEHAGWKPTLPAGGCAIVGMV